MNIITAKKITLNGKSLSLKVINQLLSLKLETDQDFECLGYYNIKNTKTYLFSNGKELKTFIDKNWTVSKAFKKQICGSKNRFRSFNSDVEREAYLKLYQNTLDKLCEDQLFY